MALIVSMWIAPRVAHAGGTIEAGHIESAAARQAIRYVIYRPALPLGRVSSLPVLYLLHGRGDDERAWVDKGDIVHTLDREIESGTIRPMIVVMPSASNSWYIDDEGHGPYGAVATALSTDLITGIESRYGEAARCRNMRAVGGLSMGGFGAMVAATERPDRYAMAFSLSGSIFSDDAADIDRRQPAYARIFDGAFGMPFDREMFLRWNIFRRMDRDAFRSQPPKVWLSAADHDFPSIVSGTVRLHLELRSRGIESNLRIDRGGHDWQYWKTAVMPALRWLRFTPC